MDEWLNYLQGKETFPFSKAHRLALGFALAPFHSMGKMYIFSGAKS
jgi:hypothetical protein